MTFFKYLLLLILPMTFIINVAYNNKTEFEEDPNYMYLFNGLNLTTHPGKVATYTQGTTVVELSAVIMRAAHLFRNTDDNFADDVLKNPQLYIKIVVRTFVILICTILFLSGLFILKMTHELTYSLIFQSIPFFSKSIIPWSFESFAAEPVLLAGVMMLVILILWKFYFNKSFGEKVFYPGNRKITIDWFSVIAGILMGFCLATKLNTFPLLLLPFLLIPKISNKFLFLVITSVSFFFFTLPVAHLYRLTVAWYWNVFTHTEIYGEGSTGIINPLTIVRNFKTFLATEPIFAVIISFSIIFLLIQSIRRKFDLNFKIMAYLMIVQLAILAVVLKHFYNYYFIPVMPTLAINVFIILNSFKSGSLLKAAIVLPLIFFSFYMNKDFNKRTARIFEDEFPADGINIFSYGNTSYMYALKIGDDASRNANSERLKEIYGDQYFYDIWYKNVITWTDTLNIDSLLKNNRKVYLHALDQYMQELPPPFDIELISGKTHLIKNP